MLGQPSPAVADAATHRRPAPGSATTAFGFAAGAVPASLTLSLAPFPSLFNEVLAFICWGLLAAHLGRQGRIGLLSRAGATPVVWALGLIVAAAWLPPLRYQIPIGLALMTTGAIAAAVVLFRLGAELDDAPHANRALAGLCLGMLFIAVLNASVALIQIYRPELADGLLIPISPYGGRASGTLRQPNQLAAMLVWGLIALGYLVATRKLHTALSWAAAVSMCIGLALSGSRTGLLNAAALSTWAALDRSLPVRLRRLLGALLPLALLFTLLFGAINAGDGTEQAVASRLTAGGGSPSRWSILRDALDLILQHPWLGTGWGEFNFVWTLTPRTWQTIHHVSNSHNLLIELLAELGIPLGLLVIGLLARGLAAACRAACSPQDPDRSVAAKCSLAIVISMVIYSQFEFPLWYAYFLLPTAFFLGVATRPPAAPSTPRAADVPPAEPRRGGAQRPMVAAGLLIALAGAFALFDAMKVLPIFVAPTLPQPIKVRIAQGQRALLFGSFADYAATTERGPVDPALFGRAARPMLDERLLLAWAEHLHARGDDDRAAFLVARARMFRSPLVDPLEQRCARDQEPKNTYPCASPSRQVSVDDFRR